MNCTSDRDLRGSLASLRQMLVHAVSSNVVAQRDLERCIEKRHHIFLEGEHVLFTAAAVFSAGMSCTDNFLF